ncbi:MAG: ABC transporter permease [Deltaproteobacteria bacterium]|nr:ABC transporter permease [Deltaproteobacteria bacterium]MBW2123689.1 ABC transporter permease [Deltaproteobacteria bacterium]
MWAYIVRRLLATIPVAGVVVVFVFLLLHLAPGDPAAVIAGNYAMPKDIERIRQKLGLNEPMHVQFGKWIWRVAHGDLGDSIFSEMPVTKLIGQRMEPTLSLAVASMLVAVLLAVPMGILAAWKAGTWIDYVVMIFAVLGFSIPVFVIAYILIFGFSIHIPIFPVQGFVSIREGLLPFLRSITLPSLALGLIYAALIARITRASLLEVLAEDYIRTAHAKGLSAGVVMLRHALKNASVPIVTIIGVGIALLIGGVVVTESVFNISGLGRLVVDSVLARDYPVIQGITLMFSGIYLLVNLIVDISYTFLDPRIQY